MVENIVVDEAHGEVQPTHQVPARATSGPRRVEGKETRSRAVSQLLGVARDNAGGCGLGTVEDHGPPGRPRTSNNEANHLAD